MSKVSIVNGVFHTLGKLSVCQLFIVDQVAFYLVETTPGEVGLTLLAMPNFIKEVLDG